jgi:2-polyprenyl-3-methyl-5-hydroxy-6-metoxy-1,4-benzoquinol methylase
MSFYKKKLEDIFKKNINTIPELTTLLEKFNLSIEQVLDKFYDYNLLINDNNNQIYDDILIRFVLFIHYHLDNSWHVEKQQLVQKFIWSININKILDLGFGVPSLYVKNNYNIYDITLSDYSKESIIFAKEVLNIWQINNVHLSQEKMEFEKNIDNYDLFIFLDSIEHIPFPTNCLKKYVNESHNNSFFLISLPICKLIPMHTIHWDNEEQATSWLNECGLEIINSKTIYPNYEVDIFANLIQDSLSNYVVLCKKTGNY